MKRAIPQPNSGQIAINTAVKETLDLITGRSVEPIKQLSTGATQAEIISKLNEVIARLQ